MRPIVLILSLAMALAFTGGARAQSDDETLADIRQELSILYVEIQKLKRELSTTGNAGALEAVMARLDDAPAAPIRVDRGVLPAPVRAYIGGDLDAVKWKPVGMGVKQAVLKTSDSAAARLLYIPAGAAMPEHSHRGMELTLVLQGAFADDSDRFGPGDVEIADDEVDHTPVADVGADCICLAATEGKLRFKSWIPRLAQPFIGI